jgi:hypothetical protein
MIASPAHKNQQFLPNHNQENTNKQTNKEPHTTATTAHLFTKPTLYTRKNCATSFPSFHHQENTIFTT